MGSYGRSETPNTSSEGQTNAGPAVRAKHHCSLSLGFNSFSWAPGGRSRGRPPRPPPASPARPPRAGGEGNQVGLLPPVRPPLVVPVRPLPLQGRCQALGHEPAPHPLHRAGVDVERPGDGVVPPARPPSPGSASSRIGARLGVSAGVAPPPTRVRSSPRHASSVNTRYGYAMAEPPGRPGLPAIPARPLPPAFRP